MVSSDIGLALWLTLCAIGNVWFIVVSVQRCRKNQGLLEAALLGMAVMDLPWVWFCLIQCWYNTFNSDPLASFSQHSAEIVGSSVGCDFMGVYSSYSLVAMMGSNFLVAAYTLFLCFPASTGGQLVNRMLPTRGRAWRVLAIPFGLILFPASVLFAAFPKLQGDGYKLTNGGFCYADWTSPTQAAVILTICLVLLCFGGSMWGALARQLWNTEPPSKAGVKTQKETSRHRLLCLVLINVVMFFCVWFLWIPAAIIGMAKEQEPAPPYMIIGGIAGHGQALANPILYGFFLYRFATSYANQDFLKSETVPEAVDTLLAP